VETFHLSGTARENCTEQRCVTAQKLETPAMGVVEKPEVDLPRFDQLPQEIMCYMKRLKYMRIRI
jgi:hypothetical protein